MDSPLALILALSSAGLHASWNLLVRGERDSDFFLRIPAVIAVLGLGPALLAEANGTGILSTGWRYIPIAGTFQAIYYLGLTRGYRSGDFNVVYPVARAAPVLLVAVADIVRGHPPTVIGWLGLALVTGGCVLTPHESLNHLNLARYKSRTTLWIAVAALGTLGYTVVDSAAAEALAPGLGTALRYHVFEAAFSLPAYWLILAALRQPIRYAGGWSAWKLPTLAAAFLFSSYTLMLWAYQLTPHTSYIVAARQFSIVIGVVGATLIFREPAPGFRFTMALIITAGVLCIGWGG
jgi:drug/metabolite transporter (DMT)-like permease